MINGQHIKNSAQIPNVIFDEVMCQLTDGELRVYLCIARKTFGFNRRFDQISVSQIERMTGLSRRGVQKALQSLITKGHVSAKLTGGGAATNEYGIILPDERGERCSPVNTVHPRTEYAANHSSPVNQESQGGELRYTGGANVVRPQNTHIQNPQIQNTETPRAPADGIDTGQLRDLIDEYSDKVCRVDPIALDYRLREAINHSGAETVERCLRAVIQAADDPAYPRDKLPRSLSALLRDLERVDSWARRYVEPDEPSTGPPVNGQALWDAKTVEWLKGLSDAEREYQFSEAHRLRQLWPEEVYRLWPQSRPRQTA